MKNLQDLIRDIEVKEERGNMDIEVSDISLSSKNIKEGSLFVAIVGNVTDGHNFISDAIESGAIVIVHEKDLEEYKEDVTYIKVEDTHKACALIANAFYDYPSEKLKLVGVTGTNGKTTIATLLYNLFLNLGYRTGLVSTVANKINNKVYEAERTTPDAISLCKLLHEMVEAECTYCFMEVSSHAVKEHRIDGLQYAGGIFTNLTLDHLDYHKTFEDYRDAKKGFFDMLSEDAFALSNIDDENGTYMLSSTKAKKYYYGFNHEADFDEHLETKLLGDFNQYNVLAIYASAVLLDEDRGKVKEYIKDLESVEGRFQTYVLSNKSTAVVDYAHTPDALENVLKTVNNLKTSKVITIVGCGGDRDKSKRPLMARIGYDNSDILILTSDNPRTEKIEDILADMKKGIEDEDMMRDDGKERVYIISDRAKAIELGASLAQEGDYILIAGKGHEKYQDINGVKNHFDDMEEVKKWG